MKASKIIALVSFGVSLVMGAILFIYVILDIASSIRAHDGTNIFSQFCTIILSVFLLIAPIEGFLKYKKKDDEVLLFRYLIAVPLFYFSFDLIRSIGMLIYRHGPLLIITIVIYFFILGTIVLYSISYAMIKKKEKSSQILTVIASLLSTVLLIVASIGTSNPFSIIIYILFIIYLVLIIVYCSMSLYGTSTPNSTNETPFMTKILENPERNSSSAQLRELKNLFDDGVITKEEYEEKRKKYIDQL